VIAEKKVTAGGRRVFEHRDGLGAPARFAGRHDAPPEAGPLVGPGVTGVVDPVPEAEPLVVPGVAGACAAVPDGDASMPPQPVASAAARDTAIPILCMRPSALNHWPGSRLLLTFRSAFQVPGLRCESTMRSSCVRMTSTFVGGIRCWTSGQSGVTSSLPSAIRFSPSFGPSTTLRRAPVPRW
jgi:hypothetical protein